MTELMGWGPKAGGVASTRLLLDQVAFFQGPAIVATVAAVDVVAVVGTGEDATASSAWLDVLAVWPPAALWIESRTPF